MKKTKRDNNGFTLIELIVVLVILSVSILIMPVWFKSLTKVKVRETARLFGAFVKRLEFESMSGDESMTILIDSNCTIKALKNDSFFIKFKKPQDVKCEVFNLNEDTEIKDKIIILVSQGYVEPIKIKFYKGKVSYIVDLGELSIWR